ncbi:MAG TPA: tail fiber protein [Vicinamibacterales bacterium]|jgi:microcystin-dependent protein|nr:tail fiber protein [Vicinamibacterales bacterium]
MSQPFLGMIIIVPYNFAPLGWAFCAGQLLPIAQNTALFSLLGTTYGGDGVQTFALPDLRGRVPVGAGQGPGLSNYSLGQTAGSENVSLTVNEMPAHTHPIALNNLAATANARNAAGNSQTPVGNLPAVEAAGVTATYSNAPANAVMAPGAISVTGTATAGAIGGGVPVSILSPYQTFNYCIALQGIFPSRN